MQKRIVITVGAVIALTLTTGFAQHATAPEYSSNSKLVLVPVTVTNRQGAFVAGLTKENFGVYEDGALQSITVFANEDLPVTVGILVDESRSMTPNTTVL